MKVKCVRLLDHGGSEMGFSPWLEIGKIHHVLSIFIDATGNRRLFFDFEPPGEWRSSAEHQAECFEIVSNVVPSNWRVWIHEVQQLVDAISMN